MWPPLGALRPLCRSPETCVGGSAREPTRRSAAHMGRSRQRLAPPQTGGRSPGGIRRHRRNSDHAFPIHAPRSGASQDVFSCTLYLSMLSRRGMSAKSRPQKLPRGRPALPAECRASEPVTAWLTPPECDLVSRAAAAVPKRSISRWCADTIVSAARNVLAAHGLE